MAITLVQSQRAAGNSGTSASATLTGASTAGNLLVLLVDSMKNPGDTTFTPPANWVQVGLTQHQDIFIAISGAMYYYPNNPGGITSVAVTLSVASSAWHIEVLEFSGVATASPFDVGAIQTQQATTTPTSGSVTTTQAGDLLVGYMSEDDVNGAYTLTQPSGWTALPRQQDTNAWGSLYSAWQVQAAAGAIAYNPTLSSTATDSVVGIMAFKAASGGGTTVNGSGNEIANSVLAASSVALTSTSAPVQANSAATQTAQLVNPSAPTAANSAITEAAQIITSSDPLPANSVLVATPASVTVPSAPMQANSALVATGHIQTPPPQLIANSALVVTAQIITATPQPLASNSAIVQTAQIITALVAVASNSVLVATGVSRAQSLAGSVTLADTLANAVAITDTLVALVAITDTAVALVTIGDSPAEVGSA